MRRKNRFTDISQEVSDLINTQSEKAFTEKRLITMFESKKSDWNLLNAISGNDFINFLLAEKVLKRKDFINENGRVKSLYHLPVISDYSVYTGFKRNSYFTHYTAMWLNNLTLQIPKTVYLNHEHYGKAIGTQLSQEKIDDAFSKTQRRSNRFYQGGGIKVVILNGQYTGKLGVEYRQTDDEYFAYSNIERTLIDISIRPGYAGGVFEVLNAFKLAKSRVDLKRLDEYLRKLDFTYPYNQIIGFYLEKAGYDKGKQVLFENEKKFRFYLTYNIKQKEFSRKWNLWYPKGM
ncbi:hypothetical protein KC980_04375 [candidate division WWE3 bacterium]|uniref:AbiEi antitoxin C-terminal domain-containing protein n=1 Tax=candidate division WWE3 bacterium TaxID=2053526 RepID=A0A955EEM7_UNCKA|nr:hypothetical protein [candidate division WWE3 bacterium]MCB0540127.1 hypothetical protein [Bacteroidota bacterium]